MASRTAPPEHRAAALILLLEDHLTAVRNPVAVPGLDVQGSPAVVKERQAVEMLILVGLDVDPDLVAVPSVLDRGIIGDRRIEVRA